MNWMAIPPIPIPGMPPIPSAADGTAAPRRAWGDSLRHPPFFPVHPVASARLSIRLWLVFDILAIPFGGLLGYHTVTRTSGVGGGSGTAEYIALTCGSMLLGIIVAAAALMGLRALEQWRRRSPDPGGAPPPGRLDPRQIALSKTLYIGSFAATLFASIASTVALFVVCVAG